jgi:spermidine synthase
MEVSYPNAHLDVVEIDPEVTKVSYEYLGLPKTTRIRTFNEDGRWYVMNCRERYDLLFIDAYNDLSLPYHLTTAEFALMLKDLMNPGGIMLTNIIDNFQSGSFLPSYVRTLREVFGDHNVFVLSVSPDFARTRISTFIVMTGKGSIDAGSFVAFLKRRGGDEATSAIMPEAMLESFLGKSRSVVLRDDYAPVDNLILPVFEARFGYNRKER